MTGWRGPGGAERPWEELVSEARETAHVLHDDGDDNTDHGTAWYPFDECPRPLCRLVREVVALGALRDQWRLLADDILRYRDKSAAIGTPAYDSDTRQAQCIRLRARELDALLTGAGEAL